MKYASTISRALNFLKGILAVSGITYLGIVLFVLRFDPDKTNYNFVFYRDSNLILNLYFYVSLFLYCFLFELLACMTQEKSVTGTRVVVMEGQESAIGKILLRTLIRVLLLPVEWLLFLRSKPIGWHDSESKTEVILK